MTPDATTTLSLDYDLDLERSLKLLMNGGGDPTQHLERGHYWKATRTPAGPATLHLVQAPGRQITAELWGPGAEWLLPHVPGLLGVHDVPEAFAPPEGSLLHTLQREQRGLRLVRAPWIHEVLVQVILQQRVSSMQAFGGYRTLVRLHGEPAPGGASPGGHPLMLPVAPRLLAHLPADVFTRASVDHQRAEALRAASLVYRRVDELVGRDSAAVRERLHHIRGVGVWTVETVLTFAYGDPDAVPLGDFNTPHTVAWALAQETRGDDARMLELLEPFRGQRGRVLRLLESGGVTAPRFGPRLRLPGPPRRPRR